MLWITLECDSCERPLSHRWVHPVDSAETMAEGLEAEALRSGWVRTNKYGPIKGAGWQCPACRDKAPTPAPANPGD